VTHVDRLVAAYEASVARNPKVRAEFVKRYDYIAAPKETGYRSVHLIFKYRSQSSKHRAWNGLRVEIQLRSRLQHAWATAVETVDTFTRQTLRRAEEWTGGGVSFC
jgi:putative GTP pyrophosphokinase